MFWNKIVIINEELCECTKYHWVVHCEMVKFIVFYYLFIYFCLFAFSRAAPAAYGGSQARGQIGAVATGLCQSHSNAGSEPHLRPTPQLTAMPNP